VPLGSRHLPKAVGEGSPKAALEEKAADWLKDSPPAAVPLEEPIPISAPQTPAAAAVEPAAPPRKPAEALFTCRRCGQPVRRQRECPVCDGVPDDSMPVDPESAATPAGRAVGIAPHSLELDELAPAGLADEDGPEPDPYLLADRDIPRCPKCHKDMAVGAVLCTSCGFNRQTRKKAGRTYEPIDRAWDSDMTLMTRLAVVGAMQGFHLFLTICAAVGGVATPFLVAWLPLTLLLCFVLGTYDRIELKRDTRGRVTLTQTWRFFFVPMTPRVTEVRGFEGVLMGQWNDAGPWEWLIFIVLCIAYVLPALIWWYQAIYRNTFHVALARDHGRAELFVYRGRKEEQMHEIARTLCDAAGLRLLT
jgi:hypothetical protein